jgi:hypothetical protein
MPVTGTKTGAAHIFARDRHALGTPVRTPLYTMASGWGAIVRRGKSAIAKRFGGLKPAS